jgi:hypothetical protein
MGIAAIGVTGRNLEALAVKRDGVVVGNRAHMLEAEEVVYLALLWPRQVSCFRLRWPISPTRLRACGA